MVERNDPHELIRFPDAVVVRRTPRWSPDRIASERNGERLRSERNRDRARVEELATRVSTLLTNYSRTSVHR